MSARGERLDQGLAPEVQALIFKPRLEREIKHALEHMHAINQAHLLMLVQGGLIPLPAARALAQAMLELETLGQPGMPNDPSLEDLYFNYESALTERVGIAAGGSLHVGRSRNDIGATIDRMRARAEVLGLVEKINEIRETLIHQAETYANVVMPGYTHLQASQPVTFGFYLLGVEIAFSREVERLLDEITRMDHSPLGAGAMAGTSFLIDRTATAVSLGFGAIAEHTQDAVASRDYMLSLCGTCVSLSTLWSRLVQDFYVWSTAEFGLISFPDNVAGVSSIMPQKKNPVVIEVLKANAGEIIGDYTAMLSTMRTTHFTHSIDATRASLNRAWAIFENCNASATLIHLLVRSVLPKRERMLTLSLTSFSTMTDLADFLTQKHGVPFREAHSIVGNLVRIAMERQITPKEITAEMIEEAAQKVASQQIRCAQQDITAILDPIVSVNRRVSMGSPALCEVVRMIEHQRTKLSQARNTVGNSLRQWQSAKANLHRSIRGLALETTNFI